MLVVVVNMYYLLLIGYVCVEAEHRLEHSRDCKFSFIQFGTETWGGDISCLRSQDRLVYEPQGIPVLFGAHCYFGILLMNHICQLTFL